MSNVKLAIVYYSTYGTNHAMAEIAAEAARAAGAEVRLRRVAETAPEAVVAAQDAWASAAAKQATVPSPRPRTWNGPMPISSPAPPASARRPARSGPSSTRWAASGSRASWPTRRSAPCLGPEPPRRAGSHDPRPLHHFLHWGSVIVAPGYTDASIFAAGGNPYGYSHTQGAALDDKARAAIAHQAKRLVEIAGRLAA